MAEHVFESGISCLFQEPEFNAGDGGDVLQVELMDRKITLAIPNVLPKNTFLFAHHVWKASILLSKTLADMQLSNLNILELGAGTGLPSIVAALKGAHVTASDYPDPNIIAALELNLKTNCPNATFSILPHIWGERTPNLTPEQFDIILLADTLWMSHQHANLLDDLRYFLKKEAKVLGCAGFHSGKQVVSNFFDIAKDYGFVSNLTVRKIPIGHGFCENMEWQFAQENQITDDVIERLRYLYLYDMHYEKCIQ